MRLNEHFEFWALPVTFTLLALAAFVIFPRQEKDKYPQGTSTHTAECSGWKLPSNAKNFTGHSDALGNYAVELHFEGENPYAAVILEKQLPNQIGESTRYPFFVHAMSGGWMCVEDMYLDTGFVVPPGSVVLKKGERRYFNAFKDGTVPVLVAFFDTGDGYSDWGVMSAGGLIKFRTSEGNVGVILADGSVRSSDLCLRAVVNDPDMIAVSYCGEVG